MPSRVSSMRGPVTAVTLLSALVVALRGWLPDATGAAGSTPAERESGGPASLILSSSAVRRRRREAAS